MKQKYIIFAYSFIVVVILTAFGSAYAINKNSNTIKSVFNKSGSGVSSSQKENMKNAGWTSYMKKMQHSIKANWNPPSENTNSSTVLQYRVQKDGRITNIKIAKSSGNKRMDETAIKALNDTSPLEPLPEFFTGKFVDVNFTFNYNYDYNYKRSVFDKLQKQTF